MTTSSNLFAVAYLVGTVAGIGSGLAMPWHLSGVVGWVTYIVGGIVMWEARKDFERTLAAFRDCAPRDLRQRAIKDHVARQVRQSVVRMGIMFGCFSGAFAVGIVQVVPALEWPGHTIDGALLALLVALAWAVGTVASDERDINPGVAGFGLYLVVVALAMLPVLWGSI